MTLWPSTDRGRSPRTSANERPCHPEPRRRRRIRGIARGKIRYGSFAVCAAQDDTRCVGVCMSEMSYRDAIRAAMMEEMDRDPSVLIMGEDIGIYEGTFRITAGMLKKYGPKRVIDTPIAEAGMAGAAVRAGAVGVGAMAGVGGAKRPSAPPAPVVHPAGGGGYLSRPPA